MDKIKKMKNEKAEYNCNGVIYGYNTKTLKFYMESSTHPDEFHHEFKENCILYYDMLSHINHYYL